MIISRTKRFFLVIPTLLTVGLLSASSFGADVSEKGTGTQPSDSQTDKERLIESRKAQQQKRGELRDAVKSGASQDELEKRKNQVKEGQKAIVKDKKAIREQKLGSTKDQNATKPDTKSKDTTSKDATSKDTTSKDATK